ncbi:MAG TPA: hypothetical protein VHI74_02855, partial [Methyloceanibacter sp.]|nr:hypothetical protein [Methyloceanibacter sp.]
MVRLAWAMGVLSGVILTLFIAILSTVNRPDAAQSTEAHASIRCAWAPTCSAAHGLTITTAADPEALKTASKLAAELREQERSLRTHHPQAATVDRHTVPASLTRSDGKPLTIGFYMTDDDNGYPALKRALPRLDWVVPDWLSVSGPSMELKSDIDDRALSYIQATKPGVAVLPMIQNAAEGNWDGVGLA